MEHVQSLPWVEPLEFARGLQPAAFRETDWILLYSGVRTSYSGRYSYLACHPQETVQSDDFGALAARLSHDHPRFANAWFGYLGYGLKNSLEILPQDEPNWLRLPNLTMSRFGTIYQFDHERRAIDVWSEIYPILVYKIPDNANLSLPEVISIRSNMDKQEYLGKAAIIIERIRAGDIYQANLTRKFIGSFRGAPEPFSLFCRLCKASPATYSAFLKVGNIYILSSSPEQFLSVDTQGTMQTRPIKGTAPRFSDPALDRQSFQKLAESIKDKAENLMIADLMRNDLSRSCLQGSVRTQSLFDITSHATIHHLSSTVIGKKRPDCRTINAISYCFPPGSMTGAPKIRAMEICSELEKTERGVYSGALGWLGGDGSADLSVVIRTLILQGSQFEFQVGGGIVSDSVPGQEWQETMDKARGILNALGMTDAQLAF